MSRVSSEARNKARSHLLGQPFKPITKTLDFEGRPYDLSCRDAGQRISVIDAAGVDLSLSRLDPQDIKISLAGYLRGAREAVFQCTYVHGTNERVFEEADREEFERRYGGFIDAFGATAFGLCLGGGLEPNPQEGLAEGLGKGSGETPSVSSSSG